ncbi:hypothetical protein D3C73_1126790 [compost metagenome]
MTGRQHLQLFRLAEIAFIEQNDPGFAGSAEILKNRIHNLHLLLTHRRRGIHYMEHQIGFIYFFQGCPEGGHQIMRQVLNEPNRVREYDFFARRKLQYT